MNRNFWKIALLVLVATLTLTFTLYGQQQGGPPQGPPGGGGGFKNLKVFPQRRYAPTSDGCYAKLDARPRRHL
ncbi:MAG: hypothetical protein U0Y68_07870 [Blastocatellia bacterium]